MRRRDFMVVVSSAVTWPLAARAQQSAKPPTIGFLGAATPIAWKEWVAAFVQRLHELNWIEGRTVKIEYRWAEGKEERYTELAAEFVRLKVDVIVTSGAAVNAAKHATSSDLSTLQGIASARQVRGRSFEAKAVAVRSNINSRSGDR